MGIQDDCFDVVDALEGKSEAEAFDRIWKSYVQMENFLESAQKALSAIEHGAFWQKSIERGDWKEWLK